MDRTIFRAFKGRGLGLSADACRALASVLVREEDGEGSLALILDEIKDRIDKRQIASSVIDEDVISSVVAYLSSSEEDLAQESTQLFDAFSSPKVVFDERTKTYKVDPKPAYNLHGTVETRAHMFRERLLMTQQRLLRSGMFAMRGMGGAASSSSSAASSSSSSASSSSSGNGDKGGRGVHEISTIESLLGSEGTKLLFGLLTQPEEGAWFLEDLDATIRLDLSRARSTAPLLTEGSLVLVEGQLCGNAFRAQMVAAPPSEDRATTLSAMSLQDPFGYCLRPQQHAQMLELETAATESLFVILSDIQLDRPSVLEKLQRVFEGFEASGAEPVFILMGNFVNKPATAPGGREGVTDAFSGLADAIAACPRLARHAKFLLVPGPQDVGTHNALPRRPIPEIFTKDLRKKVAHVTFASNPCRLRFYTQEIVLFREDLLRKMQRHTVLPPQPHAADAVDAPELTEQLVEAVLDQAHLCPLPLQAKPVHWELDYTLRLAPLPHLLVLADHADQYAFDCKGGCQAVNPGSFSSDYSFVVYRPATQECEFSRVPS